MAPTPLPPLEAKLSNLGSWQSSLTTACPDLHFHPAGETSGLFLRIRPHPRSPPEKGMELQGVPGCMVWSLPYVQGSEMVVRLHAGCGEGKGTEVGTQQPRGRRIPVAIIGNEQAMGSIHTMDQCLAQGRKESLTPEPTGMYPRPSW
jgi:hypothetical protein